MSDLLGEVDGWGIPNWRDPDAYGDTTLWTLNRWRWEFTRRREDYRADFARALAGQVDPLELPIDVAEIDAERLKGLRAWPFFHRGAARYGLGEFWDPVISDWPTEGPEWKSGIVIGGYDGIAYEVAEDGGYVEVPAPHRGAVTFDLSRPLQPQVAEALETLQKAQELFLEDSGIVLRKTKLHVDKWLTYLRVIDGRRAGASLADIAAILPNHVARRDQKAAHNVIRQAELQAFRF